MQVFYSILKELIIMERKFVRKDEQIKLIMECRQSGLSDYQWCRQRDINPGTFYNWVSRLRKSGYTFPDSQSKSVGTPAVQEVVKLDVAEQEESSPVIERNACPLPLSRNTDVAAELIVGNVTLRLFNGANQKLVQSAMQYLGGVSRVW